MRIGVFGTGTVGRVIAGRLVEVGHEVAMGSREAGNPAALAWSAAAGDRARAGTFADAAAFGEVLVNATAGSASLAALRSAGEDRLADRVLIDVANPLDFSTGMPQLTIANTDSLAEQIQRAFPRTLVVKALNTMNADVMVRPGTVPGEHDVFLAGDSSEAKQVVAGLLAEFGWPASAIVDVGGIGAARGLEMYLPLWIALRIAIGTNHFNIRVVHSGR